MVMLLNQKLAGRLFEAGLKLTLVKTIYQGYISEVQ